MLPGPSTALVMVVALLGVAAPQTVTAAVEPSPSPQTDAKRLVITVPEGGSVRSLSNNHMCSSGETCEIEIDDEFHEVFIPWHEVGYRFNSWKQSSEHFCGRAGREVHHHHWLSRFGYPCGTDFRQGRGLYRL